MKISIATASSAKSKNWKNKEIEWNDFAESLSIPHYTRETYREFCAMTKAEQSSIKDVGGYVGGYLVGGRRKIGAVGHRSIICLDLDFADSGFWFLFTMLYRCEALLHSTHKHSQNTPRFRLILPLSRTVTSEEYIAISRRLAGNIGIELFDPTTFQAERLMYWQSTSKDAEYIFERQTGGFLDPDQLLEEYHDWRDISLYPSHSTEKEVVKKVISSQENPTEKKGMVGTFCRTYSITEVIESLLPGTYTKENDGRYTYTGGSTSGGLVVYDDIFAYSHHSTDPCCSQLCNAFDLFRIHSFGHLEGDSAQHKKSQSKALEAIRKDKKVLAVLAEEKVNSAKDDFNTVEAPAIDLLGDAVQAEEVCTDWMVDLETDAKGNYMATATNLKKIFANDSALKKSLCLNEFDSKRYLNTSVPWREWLAPEPVKNADYSGIRVHIEAVYGITSVYKIDDAIALHCEVNKFNPVKDYLNAQRWDGVQRVDELLIKYLGAEDSQYTRVAIRKMLVGAVKRILEPGCKFDLVLTLVGGQGVGKSTFIRKLGRGWSSDSFSTVTGNASVEQLQGCWLVEMAELAGLKKAEVETTKQFISKQFDLMRPAYGRVVERYKRQCVFFATTNNYNFLKDPTGNRRFLPVDVHEENIQKSVFTDELDNETNQIWAEAVELYKAGETTYLDISDERLAKEVQEEHAETDERLGLIDDFLNCKLPTDWNEKNEGERRNWLITEDFTRDNHSLIEREFVCVAEIWCECLGKEKSDMNRYSTRDLNDLMKTLKGWQYVNSTKNFIYGKQKYYKRVK